MMQHDFGTPDGACRRCSTQPYAAFPYCPAPGEVYVVARGERGEGCEPVAVTATLFGAMAKVRDRFLVTEMTEVEPGEWQGFPPGGKPVDEVWIFCLPFTQ